MTDTIQMIAVGREPKRKIFYECGTWFFIRPAHNSREFSIFAEERRAMQHVIQYMEFISNDHIITQFSKIPPKDVNSCVVKNAKA